MDKSFKKDIEKVRESFENKKKLKKAEIQGALDAITEMQNEMKEYKDQLNQIQDTLSTLDGKAYKLWEEREWLRKKGFARLDGRIAKALDKRKLGSIMNLKKRPTQYLEYDFDLRDNDQYWCQKWFVQVVKNIPQYKRQEFYETLEQLKGNHEELQRQIGMWLLDGVD